jgi:hypothetical protein
VRPEEVRPEGAAPPTGTTAAGEQETRLLAARALATRRADTTTKGGKKSLRTTQMSSFFLCEVSFAWRVNVYKSVNEKYSLSECKLARDNPYSFFLSSIKYTNILTL